MVPGTVPALADIFTIETANALAVEHLLIPSHREIPGFKAAREFCGRHDTCGPNALNEVLAALDPKRFGPVGCATMNRLVAEMQAHGWMSTDPRGVGGCTMSDIVAEAHHLGLSVLYPQAWHWHPALDLATVHSVIASCRYDEGYGVVLQVGRAYNLPDNEHGVDSHFVAIGGVDPTLGYKVGNGDIPAGTFHGAEWVGWTHIAAAVPTAICVISLHGASAGGPDGTTPDPNPPTPKVYQPLIDAGWTDSANWDPSVDAARLQAPNGNYFTKGFRADVIEHGLDPSDLPRTNELSDGTVSTQPCLKTQFDWSQSTGVVRSPIAPVGLVLAHIVNVQGSVATPPPSPVPSPAPGPVPNTPAVTPRQLAAEQVCGAMFALLVHWDSLNTGVSNG